MSNKIDYNEMTNAELKALIDDFELTVDAKTPGKPNKAELVSALENYRKQQNIINGVEEDETEDLDETNDELTPGSKNEIKVEKAVPQKLLPREQKKRLQKADLLRKERVIVIDKQHTQTRIPAITVTWGNKLIGIQTDVIDLKSNKPQHVRRGALANLRDCTFTYSYQEEEFAPVKQVTEKRFEIRELEGLTEDEIADLAIKQRMNKRYADVQ